MTYPVPFIDLQKRYNLKQSALSYRIKSLGIKTQRRSRNTFLSVKQLDLLDKLNSFLKEDPTQTIENFIDSQSGNESLINQVISTESPMYHSPISDTPMMHHPITDNSLINQSDKELEQRIIALESTLAGLCKQKTISENSLATNESLIDSENEKELYDLDNENDRLWEENSLLQQTVKELEQKLEEFDKRDTRQRVEYNKLQNNFNQLNKANQATNQQLNNLALTHQSMLEFYQEIFYLPFNKSHVIKFVDGEVYVKIKPKSFEEAYERLKATS